jgi:tetratricopeptide (TPR) repeat protein
MDLTFFNPRSQKEDDFIASFVARHLQLDFYLHQLRRLGKGEAAKHHLMVAPRGFGKTSLLRRIAIAVRADAELRARYIPLSFREEQHNVISLDVFWRNCLQSLLEAREDEEAPAAELESIDQAWEQHSPRHALPREEQDGEPAWQEFNSRCTALGRRPLLLVDNLDSLLAGLDANHQWSLRRILQATDGPVLVAASSRYPDSTHDPAAAFYDFFRIQTLDRLDNAEVLHCLKSLAQHRGEPGKPVLDLLQRDPGRIAALNTLAGGNPRTLSVLYGVLESHMSADVLSQLSAMLDTFTSWYQARTDELPIQTRAVFDALALNWDPMTASALSEATGLTIQITSSQISRLEKLGFAEAVALSRRGKGRSGYQVVERFFNIWYLMRNGPRRAKQSIKFLTVFLQSCFSVAERRSIGRHALSAESIDPSYAVALASTIGHGSLRYSLLDRARAESTALAASAELEPLIQELREPPPGKRGAFLAPADDASLLLLQGAKLIGQGQLAQALAKCESVVSRFGEADEGALRNQVALALLNKGFVLSRLGRAEDALAAYNDLEARYSGANERALRKQVAWALFNKGLVLRQLGRPDEAIIAYGRVVIHCDETTGTTLREPAARALVAKGRTLTELGHIEEAISAYDSVVTRFGEATEADIREQVALALLGSAEAKLRLHRTDSAASDVQRALALRPNSPRLLNSLGNLLLDEAGNASGALAAFQQGLRLIKGDDNVAVLHCNSAYAAGLHLNDPKLAREHADAALNLQGDGITAAGRFMLSALALADDTDGTTPVPMFEAIHQAVDSGDLALWTKHIDDLQRLLWWIIHHGHGPSLRTWMEGKDYPLRQAPLYHAIVALIEGEDHLLKINPEVRAPAERIYAGIARRLVLYGKKPKA